MGSGANDPFIKEYQDRVYYPRGTLADEVGGALAGHNFRLQNTNDVIAANAAARAGDMDRFWDIVSSNPNLQVGEGEASAAWRSLRFGDLWSNHPGNWPDTPNVVRNRNCPCTAGDGTTCSYPNQCAVRMSVALQDSGIDMSSFRGAKCGNADYAIRANELANWLSNSSRLGKPEVFRNGNDALRRITGVTGVVFIKQFVGVDFPNQRWNHIDVWNGHRLGLGRNQYFTNSLKEVWFWPKN